MNKNAYEIRLEVLQMADDALMTLFTEKCSGMHKRQEKGHDLFTDPKDFFPSVAEIRARAAELYKFVELQK